MFLYYFQELQKVKQVIPKDYVVKKVYTSDTHSQVAPPVQSSAAPNKALVQTKILAHAQPLPAHVIQQMYAGQGLINSHIKYSKRSNYRPGAQYFYGGGNNNVTYCTSDGARQNCPHMHSSRCMQVIV